MGEQWLDLPADFDRGHDYMPEIDHFLTCVQTGQKPLVTPEDAANTIIGGLYALQACKEKKVLAILSYTVQPVFVFKLASTTYGK